jgi:precorrin-6B methylase 2
VFLPRSTPASPGTPAGRPPAPEPSDGWLGALAGAAVTPTWLRRRLATLLGYREVHAAPIADSWVRVLARGSRVHLRFGDAWEDQAVLDRDDPFRLVLPYTRAAAVGLALPPRLGRVLHVGLGGGTMARVVRHVAPEARQRAVEPYAAVVEAARRWFALPEDLEVLLGHAPAALDRVGPHDLVFWDAFTCDGAPVPLLDPAAARRALEPRGWLVVNTTSGLSEWAERLGTTFGAVGWVRVPEVDQHVIFAGPARDDAGAEARAEALSARLGLALGQGLEGVRWVG